MRRTSAAAGCLTALALMATPAVALPTQASDHATQAPGQTKTHEGTAATPGPSADAKAKGRAYGRYCAGQSKEHVKGIKGTAFSRCVTGMAKLASGETDSPTVACKALSKKHVKGTKGTAYSRCITAAAKLRHDQKANDSK